MKEEMVFPLNPRHEPTGIDSVRLIGGGLTKRELFAAQALTGLVAVHDIAAFDARQLQDLARGIAAVARTIADALIVELAKEKP